MSKSIEGRFGVESERYCADQKKLVRSTKTLGHRTLYMHVELIDNKPFINFYGFESYRIDSLKRMNLNNDNTEFCVYHGKTNGMASVFVNKKEVFDFIDMELEKL